MRQGACVGSGRHPTTTCTHTGAMRHATSGTSMEAFWVLASIHVGLGRLPRTPQSEVADRRPGGVCVRAIGPGHQASDRQPAMWLSMSICAPPRYDCTRELRSQGPPPPPPGPGVGGLALVVTAAGPHLPPPHMSPPTSLLQPTAPQSPPTKAPGIVQSRSPRHCPKPPQRPLLVQQFVPPRPPHARVPRWGEGEARGRTRSTVAERSLDALRDADAADGSSIGAKGRPQRRGVTAGSCRLVLCSTKGRQHPRRRAAPAR